MIDTTKRQVWLPIPTSPNYEVSTGGGIRKLERKKNTASMVRTYIEHKIRTQGVTIKDNQIDYDLELPILMGFMFFDVDMTVPNTHIRVGVSAKVGLLQGGIPSVDDLRVHVVPAKGAAYEVGRRELSKRGAGNELTSDKIIKAITAEEFWADIPGYNFYKVSSQGRVRSERGATDNTRYLTATNGNVKGTAVKRFTLRDHHGKPNTYLAHDLVARSFFKMNMMFGQYMEHTIEAADGDLSNVRLDNLIVKHLTGASGLELAPLVDLKRIYDAHGTPASGQLSLLTIRTNSKVEEANERNAFANIMRGSFSGETYIFADLLDAKPPVAALPKAPAPAPAPKAPEAKKETIMQQYFLTPEEAMNAPIVDEYPPKTLFKEALTTEYWRRFYDARFVVSSFGRWMLVKNGELALLEKDKLGITYTPPGKSKIVNNFSQRRAVAMCFLPSPVKEPGHVGTIDGSKDCALRNTYWNAFPVHPEIKAFNAKEKAPDAAEAQVTEAPAPTPAPTAAPVAPLAPTPTPRPTPAPASAPTGVFKRPDGFPKFLAFSVEEARMLGPDDGPYPVDSVTAYLVANYQGTIWRRYKASNSVFATDGSMVKAMCYERHASECTVGPIPYIVNVITSGHSAILDPTQLVYQLFVGEAKPEELKLKKKKDFSLANIERRKVVDPLAARMSVSTGNPNIRMGVLYGSVSDLALAHSFRTAPASTFPPPEKLHTATEVWRQYMTTDIAASSHGALVRLNPHNGASYMPVKFKNVESTVEVANKAITNGLQRVRVCDIFAMCFAPLPEGLKLEHAISQSNVDYYPTADSVFWVENADNPMPAPTPAPVEVVVEAPPATNVVETALKVDNIEVAVTRQLPNGMGGWGAGESTRFCKGVLELLVALDEKRFVAEEDLYPPAKFFQNTPNIWRRYGQTNLLVCSDGRIASVASVNGEFSPSHGFSIISTKPSTVLDLTIYETVDGKEQRTATLTEYAGDIYAQCFVTLPEGVTNVVSMVLKTAGVSRSVEEIVAGLADSRTSDGVKAYWKDLERVGASTKPLPYDDVTWTQMAKAKWITVDKIDNVTQYLEIVREGELSLKIVKVSLEFIAANEAMGIEMRATNISKVASMVGLDEAKLREVLDKGSKEAFGGWVFTRCAA